MPLRTYGRLFGQVHGDGPPLVVALHGWGRRGADFDAVLAGLDAVALDLPGFGATPPPDLAMGAVGYAEAVRDALTAVGTGPFVLVGHSFGGRVATVLAATNPDLASGLVLTGVPLIRRGGGRKPSMGYRLLRKAHDLGLVSDDRMERERRSRGSADYRAATGVMRDVLVMAVNESYEAQLADLRCRVSLVWGAEDLDVPPAVAVAARDVLAAAGVPVTLEILPGVGHLTPTAAPEAVRRAVEAMLG